MKWLWWAAAAVFIGGIIGLIKEDPKIVSPLGIKIEEPKKEIKRFITVGFLPTWEVGKTRLYGDEIDELIFSSVAVEADGSLVWDAQSKKINDDSYKKLRQNISRNGSKNILGIKQFDDDKIDKILKSDESRKKLISEVAEVVKEGRFDGVNVDFEYMSDPARIADEDFLAFFKEAKAGGWGEISTDVFANTVIKGDSEELAKLADSVDLIIVMAYDFHRPGSALAGPVAPIAAGEGQRSISEIIDKIVGFNLNNQKFIMAYPLYGYQWATNSSEYGSATMTGGYGATVFYSDGIGLTGVQWDEQSQSPWAAWTEQEKRSKQTWVKSGKRWKKVTTYYTVTQWHQAYFENEDSLKAKLNLAKISGMRGTGYWALGYEGTTDDLLARLDDYVDTTGTITP